MQYESDSPLFTPGSLMYGSQGGGVFFVVGGKLLGGGGRELPTDPQSLEDMGVVLTGAVRDAVVKMNVGKQLEVERAAFDSRKAQLEQEGQALFKQREEQLQSQEKQKFSDLPEFLSR